MYKSIDGGVSWNQIYDRFARLIDFNTSEEALPFLNEDYCDSDIYQSSDVIGFTNDSGDT